MENTPSTKGGLKFPFIGCRSRNQRPTELAETPVKLRILFYLRLRAAGGNVLK